MSFSGGTVQCELRTGDSVAVTIKQLDKVNIIGHGLHSIGKKVWVA